MNFLLKNPKNCKELRVEKSRNFSDLLIKELPFEKSRDFNQRTIGF